MKKRALINMICCIIAICTACIPTIIPFSIVKAVAEELAPTSLNLSSITPLATSVGWGSVAYNKNLSGNPISLIVDGSKKIFDKGIVAHAVSTLVYDLQNYKFDFLTSYIGVDSSQGDKGNVLFNISVSNDNKTWTSQYVSPKALTGSSTAAKISVNIKGYRYLKLVANSNGSKDFDHAAYGSPKIIKAGYEDEEEKLLASFDTEIKEHGINADLSAIELPLLQRTFIKKVGYDSLKELYESNAKYKNTIDWLVNDLDTLREYLTSGEPEARTYKDSLMILSELYSKHSSDLAITTVNAVSGVVDGEVYKRMMLALSLTHTRDIAFWEDTSQKSDPIVRYEIYKDLRSNGFVENKIFDKIPVITMRLTFNSMLSDPQIAWLNNFAREKGSMNEYSYIEYETDYNYKEAQYYDAANYKTWNDKYKLAEYGIPYGKGPQLWMIFEEGGVCGALSKTGTNLNTSKGIPALVLSQPGHAAYMIYQPDKVNPNLGTWVLGNNIDGWAYSGWTWEGVHPTKWGTESGTISYPASFTLLAQAAINDMPNYVKAEEYIFLADVYKKDTAKVESICNLALSKQAINYDVWKELVNIYKTDPAKTDADRYELAERIATALNFYPNAMYTLINQLDLSITDDQIIAKSVLLKESTLKRAAQATAADTLQFNECIQLANKLLGGMDLTIANFSFDGNDANRIILSDRFLGSATRLKYSLDGGTVWIDTDSKNVLLTNEQIKSITAENDIHVGLVGSNSIQVIDIKQAPAPTNLYNNDFENAVIGSTVLMAWSFDKIRWIKFNDVKPDLEGNKSLYVRMFANDKLLASPSITFNFTQAFPENIREKYIPIHELSIFNFSTANSDNHKAANVIDGNKNTMWHTNFNGSDLEKYVTIKTSTPKYISALQYVPAQRNGNVFSGKVLTSLDGITWKVVATFANWGGGSTYDLSVKTVLFSEPVLASYVKFDADSTWGSYASAAMINLFEAIPASIDSSAGTYDLNDDATTNNRDLYIKVTNKSNAINAIKIEDRTYLLNNPEDLTALAAIMNLVPTKDGYNVTLLKSWMNRLEVKDYPITFITDNNMEIIYNLHIIDTTDIPDVDPNPPGGGDTPGGDPNPPGGGDTPGGDPNPPGGDPNPPGGDPNPPGGGGTPGDSDPTPPSGDPTPPTDTPGGNPSGETSYLNIKIAGIVAGVVTLLLSIAMIILKFRRKRNYKKI